MGHTYLPTKSSHPTSIPQPGTVPSPPSGPCACRPKRRSSRRSWRSWGPWPVRQAGWEKPWWLVALTMFKWSNDVLVGGLEHEFYFSIYIYIFFFGSYNSNWLLYVSKGLKPPTSVKYVDLPWRKNIHTHIYIYIVVSIKWFELGVQS